VTLPEFVKSVEDDVVVTYVIAYEHRYENEICFMRLPEYNVVCKELAQAYRFATEKEAAFCLAEQVINGPDGYSAGNVLQIVIETRITVMV